jgi:O-antigen/teichoic acid export membrane protein
LAGESFVNEGEGRKVEVRVRLSGLLIFLGKILSLFTGFAFSVYVARTLSKDEYGLWFLLMSLVSYFQVAQSIMPYWGGRDFARGLDVAKTLIAANLIVGAAMWLLFLLLSPLMFIRVVGDVSALMVASLFIPVYYVEKSVKTAITARWPHKLAPRDVLIDVVKLMLVVALAAFIPLRLVSVLVAVLAGYVCFIGYGLAVLRPALKGKVELSRVRRWLSMTWLPLYQEAGGLLVAASDALLVGLLMSPSSLASYGVALSIAGALKFTNFLYLALGPKILSRGVAERADVANAYKATLIFAVPILAGGMVLAPDLIRIFGSRYLEGLSALILLLLSSFMEVLCGIPGVVVVASDRTDVERRVSFKSLLRSSMFRAHTLTYLSLAFMVSTLLTLVPRYGLMGAGLALLLTSAFGSLINLAFLPGTREAWRFLPAKFMLECASASALMAVLLSFMPRGGTLHTLALIALGAAAYFAALAAISREARDMMRALWSEAVRRVL